MKYKTNETLWVYGNDNQLNYFFKKEQDSLQTIDKPTAIYPIHYSNFFEMQFKRKINDIIDIIVSLSKEYPDLKFKYSETKDYNNYKYKTFKRGKEINVK